MIRYQLRCAKEHEFEAWFKDGQTCDRQLARKSVECPICGGRKVAKALMAPRIGGGEQAKGSVQRMGVMAGAMREQLKELRDKVEANCDYVGERFAEEARKIHYGEVDPRGIYGEATDEQHQELTEEGIEVAQIPWLPRSDA